MEGLHFKTKPHLERTLNILTVIISIVVLTAVVLMDRPEYKIQTDIDFTFLAPIHATINGIVAIILIAALYFVKQKQYDKHRLAINAAFVGSALFLISYVVYHFTTDATLFCKEGNIRYLYFFLLITHIVLAAFIFPFILITYTRAFVGKFAVHKRLARWVFPIWFYVAVTGPILYLMLRPCY
ncbi:MAG: DUF420 domain-containing protein [Saprospiraceae bacterium]|nr:DUF420 domain-containing protein [Saprospiraceae bacterium]